MEIFFYCSYELSQRGFFMTRVTQEGLVPAEGNGGGPPKAVRDFFSYDCFSFLWRDLCLPTARFLEAPEITGGLCGVRNVRGRLADGRAGVVNLAFFAKAEERTPLRRVALSILGDYDAFRTEALGWLTVGGPCGYQLDLTAFQDWQEKCRNARHLHKLMPPESKAAQLFSRLRLKRPPRRERDTLYLASCTSGWETIGEFMGAPAAWKRKPPFALDEEEFNAIFTGHGPLWAMEM